MTIRLVDVPGTITIIHRTDRDTFDVHGAANTPLAGCNTRAEAEQVKRAFENVLLPRFTRDEAIALVLKALENHPHQTIRRALAAGARIALEALAAKGVFSDTQPVKGGSLEVTDAIAMRAKLDAAGIR